MRKMKESGYVWIGVIPDEWKIEKVKYAFYRKNKKAMQENPVILSLARNGVRERDISNNEGQIAESYYNYNPVDVDDLLINPMDLYSGANCSISKVKGVISPAYINLRYKEGVSPVFFDYYFKTQYWLMAFFSYGKGVSYDNRWTLNAETLMNYPIVVPSYSEQCRIADYLDSKCSKIDEYIAKQQQLIEKLKEYKQAIITEAVTKGLNPDVPMKDSGIEWIGKIPEHWDTINSNALFSQRKQKANTQDKQLTASQKYGVVYQNEYMEVTGNHVVTVERDFSILKHVEKGDFIISMRSFQGGIEYSNLSGSISSAYVMLIPNVNYVYPRYYRWLLKSVVYIKALQSTSNLVRDGQALRYSNFAQVRLLKIPMSEQHDIADYLDKKCLSIDNVILQRQKIIKKLNEYKKSLIYEMVTGKKEVPDSPNKSVTVFFSPLISRFGKDYLEELLICKIVDCLENDLKGIVHLQKILYILEMYIGFPFGNVYQRYEHGPFDVNIYSYQKELKKKNWVESKKKGQHYYYKKGKKFSDYYIDYLECFSEYNGRIEKILDFFKNKRTNKSEKVATLFAAWNDFIIDGVNEPTDSQIIKEVTTNWTDNKGDSPDELWQSALDLIKKENLIPWGFGKHTVKKGEV